MENIDIIASASGYIVFGYNAAQLFTSHVDALDYAYAVSLGQV